MNVGVITISGHESHREETNGVSLVHDVVHTELRARKIPSRGKLTGVGTVSKATRPNFAMVATSSA
jgi:hypothetical protein